MFIDHQDGLDIKIEPSKEQYGLRDSILLKINAKDCFGNPVMGTFSLAVTDTRQVDKDPVSDGNIRSYLLLQSDLKGKIEGAGYYFNKDSTGKAMDALLLTQGFVRYDWNPKEFAHKVEQEFTVSGQVVKGLKGTAPIAGTEVILASTRKNSMILKVMTDSNGHFLFQNIPSFDTIKFMVMSKNFKGKSFNVSVKVEKKDFASFEDLGFGNDYSDQVFIDRSLSVAPMRNTIRYIRPFSEVGLLNTVVITGKKKIPGSKNLNGSGNADIIFEEEDIKKMPDMNIYEFLKMNIKGYISPWGTEEQRMNDGDAGESRAFGKVGNSPVIISIDGEDVALFSRFYGSANLDLLRSDNIKGVEVMFKPKNSYRYDVRNSSPDSSSGGPSYLRNTKSNFPYHIEVTTKSGIGVRAFVESRTPGVEIYQPPIFYYGKEFYSPRYHTVEEKAEPLPDLRSTVYWNPRVITDEKGEAAVSFYSADIPTNYLIMMEGMNLQGAVGAANSRVEIRE